MNQNPDRGRDEQRAKVNSRLARLIMVSIALSSPAHAASARVFEGTYVWGAEVNTFSPCGRGDKEWWVIGSDEVIDQLKTATERLTTEPYEGLYLRVTGGYAGPATEETGGSFSTQYEGLFRISKVWSIRKTSKSDCQKR